MIVELDLRHGIGVITGRDGHDYVFHRSDCRHEPFDDLHVGQEVEFEDVRRDAWWRAEYVRVLR